MHPFAKQFVASFSNVETPVTALAALQDLYRANGVYSSVTAGISGKKTEFVKSVKSGVDSQVSFLNQVITSAVEGTEKVAQLNIAATRAAIEESGVIAKQVLNANDVREMGNFISALPQPTVTKAVAYARHLTLITTEIQAAVTRATEEQMAQASRHFLASIKELINNTPAGSQNALIGAKAVISNATESVDQLTQSAIQTVDTIEATVHDIADHAVNVAEQASTAAARARKK